MTDPFLAVRAQTDAHRAQHRCWAYPYDNAPLLGCLAAAAGASRVLELGTALGYTALWFAHAAPEAMVDTIERDAGHVRLARANIAAAALQHRIVVHQGAFAPVLAALQPGYDVAFFDGHAPEPGVLAALRHLLRPGGLLISANLTLDSGDSDEFNREIRDSARWLTAFVDAAGETALSVRLDSAQR